MSIINFNDIDLYLLNFLDFESILSLVSVSRENNSIIKESPLYQEIIKFIKLKLKKYILYNTIELASKHGYTRILEWLKNSDFKFKYTSGAIDRASKNGHISVLEWFKKSDFKFKYTSNAIDFASENGHISVLEWFKNSDFEFKYTSDAIERSSYNGHTAVLEWFDKNEFKKKLIK